MTAAVRGYWSTAALAMIVLAGLLVVAPRSAHAIPACTAEDIVNADPACPPGTGTCTIALVFEIGDGCELEFDDRDVVLATSGRLNLGSGSVIITARSFVMQPRSTINGAGDIGPSLCLITTEDLRIERNATGGAQINVSGSDFAGCLSLIVEGSLIVDGQLNATQTGIGGAGGEVVISVEGDMTTGPLGSISASSGGVDSSGGTVDISTGGNAQLAGPVTATGAEGGGILMLSEGNLTTGILDARANRGANCGGSVDLGADRSITMNGNVNVQASGPEENFGAGGGTVFAEALFGDLSYNARLTANGSSPDGFGGDVFLGAAGDIIIPSNALIESIGLGSESCGGSVELDAGIDVTMTGTVEVTGAFEGGTLAITAGRRATISGSADVKGRGQGSFGGIIEITANQNPASMLSVSGLLDASGGACSFEAGCGFGGDIDLESCVLTVPSGGRIFSRAPDGGAITLVAHKQLTVGGRIDAGTTDPVEGGDGSVTLEFPIGSPPTTAGSTISPPATLIARALCTQPPQGPCLLPCPTCGNGIVEFPETCDLGNPTPVNCSGCSSSCRTQVCDDDLICTADMCDPRLGCFAVPPTTPCFEPTSTPTISRTPTITGTPTITATPTITGTPTDTPTITPTPPVSFTPSQTATPTPTDTPSIGRPGDADCDGDVTADDFTATLAAIFESTECTGADVNRDGVVSAADLAAFVRNDPR